MEQPLEATPMPVLELGKPPTQPVLRSRKPRDGELRRYTDECNGCPYFIIGKSAQTLVSFHPFPGWATRGIELWQRIENGEAKGFCVPQGTRIGLLSTTTNAGKAWEQKQSDKCQILNSDRNPVRPDWAEVKR